MLRKLAIRMVLPITWRIGRWRMANSLNDFATAELDSAWQSLRGFQYTEDPKIRAKLFQHALEELHHARLFRSFAIKYSGVQLPGPSGRRVKLISKNDKASLIRFFADEAVGETIVRSEFSAYASAAPYPDVKDLFERIEADEIGHEKYTKQMMIQLAPQSYRSALVLALLRRQWRAWERFGMMVGEVLPRVIFSSLYLLSGLFVKRACKRQIEVNAHLLHDNMQSHSKTLGKAA